MRKISDPSTEIPLEGLESFYDEFIATRKEELKLLQEALGEQNYKLLSEQAHKWKGFSAPYGFQELEVLAAKLEEEALKADFERCLVLLNNVKEYLGDS